MIKSKSTYTCQHLYSQTENSVNEIQFILELEPYFTDLSTSGFLPETNFSQSDNYLNS